jgi:hypothetical protein
MPRGQKPKQYPKSFVDGVAKLYAAGKTQHEVAAELGSTQKVVFNVMRRHGIAARAAAKREQRGECNASWKGNNAGKQALHRRLYAKHGKPNKCSKCGTTSAHHYDYANLTGRYQDGGDYAAMCRSCHWKYDAKINNIKHMRRDADDQAKSS